MVDRKKCIGCASCTFICPNNAIKLVDGRAQIDPKKCVKCHACENICPVAAIKIK